MTNRKEKVLNLDKLKTSYCNNVGKSEEIAKSADALVDLKDEKMCVIEFKNGDFSNEEISKKALESVMIINDILKQNLDFSRSNLDYALVYNKHVKSLSYRRKIAFAKATRGADDYDFWGLGNLRNFCYREVYLIEKQDFEESILAKKIVGI